MSESLLWPFADHLCQSTLFAVLVGLLTLAFKANRAEIRYWLWFIASAKFLVPFAWLTDVGSRFSWRAPAALPLFTLPSVVAQVGGPFAPSLPFSALLPTTAATSVSVLPAILLIAWGIGFIIVICSWALRLQRIRVAMRNALPLQLPLNVQGWTSPAFSEPGVFGILKPAMLMPSGICNQLTPPQLEAIVAHELCHIRRHDNLTGTLHMLVEAVFWFHPLVWWLGARLIAERERACDEYVLQNGHDPRTYAEGILEICKLYLARPVPGFAGVMGTNLKQPNLKQRIETIMSNPIAPSMTFVKKLLLTVAGATALVVPVAIGVVNAPPLKAQVSAQVKPPAQSPKPAPIAVPPVFPPQIPTPSKSAQERPQVLVAQAAPQPAVSATPAGSAAIILMLDRSSSMDGAKMELARSAASRLVASLRPTDTIGVLTFNNNFEWAIEPRKVEDGVGIDQLLAAIRPDWGTSIAPALSEAYRLISPISANVKHVILLTDGIAETGNSFDVARAANGTVTISTVGLGTDVNTQYLETIAKLSGGKSYFAKNPQELEQILVQDVIEHIGSNSPGR